MFNYWKPLLTDYFMEEIKSRGGVLINLASGEMKDLFDWKRVEEEVRVVTLISGLEGRAAENGCYLCEDVPGRDGALHH